MTFKKIRALRSLNHDFHNLVEELDVVFFDLELNPEIVNGLESVPLANVVPVLGKVFKRDETGTYIYTQGMPGTLLTLASMDEVKKHLLYSHGEDRLVQADTREREFFDGLKNQQLLDEHSNAFEVFKKKFGKPEQVTDEDIREMENSGHMEVTTLGDLMERDKVIMTGNIANPKMNVVIENLAPSFSPDDFLKQVDSMSKK